MRPSVLHGMLGNLDSQCKQSFMRENNSTQEDLSREDRSAFYKASTILISPHHDGLTGLRLQSSVDLAITQ